MTELLSLIKELVDVEKARATVDRRKDSVDIGTPGKGGNLKVYYDASNVDEAKGLVDNAILVRQYAQEKLNSEAQGNG